MTNNAKTTAPKPLAPNFDDMPAELKTYPQWVLWRYDWNEDQKKWTKVLYNPKTKRKAKSTDPETWADYDFTVAAYRLNADHFSGVGFVFTPDDPFTGIDFDHCLTVDDMGDELSQFAKEWVDYVGSYTEVTPSNTGLHIIVKGKLAPNAKCKVALLGIEAYQQGRYFTMSGRSYHESPLPLIENQPALDYLCSDLLKRDEKPAEVDHPAAPLTNLSAQQILDRAFASPKVGFKIQSLYNGDLSGHSNDHSSADLALCNHLAFWVGGDASMLDQLFRSSSLMREKWDRRHYQDGSTYGQVTINRAIANCREFYNPEHKNGSNGKNGLNGHHKKEAKAKEPAAEPDPTVAKYEAREARTADETERGYQWDEPVSLEEGILPAFPVQVLPEYLKQFVLALAETTQTPHDLCGTIAMTAIAAAAHGKVVLNVKDDWFEWSTLYTLTAAPSGSRKSAVFKAVTAPIVAYEREIRKKEEPIVERNRNRRRVLEGQIRKYTEMSAKAKNQIERDDAQEMIKNFEKEMMGITKLDVTRFLVEDVTTERLGTLLGRHDERLGILSPEGDVFKLIAGMYNSNGKANLSIYLKSYDGEFCRMDRQDQDRTVILEHPSLAIGLAVQPAVIQRLADEHEFLDRGLVQRFLFSLTPDILGYRNLSPAPMPESVKRKYDQAIRCLMALEMPMNGQGEIEPYLIKFEKRAQVLITEYQAETETILQDRSVPDALREWRSKLPGKMARIALFLALAERSIDQDLTFERPITAETVEKAITLARYYSFHCESAFGIMLSDKKKHEAKLVLDWIKRQAKLIFSRRECYRSLQRHFANPDEMTPIFRLLFQLGYIQREQEKATKRGTAINYQVNPIWLDKVLSVNALAQVSTVPLTSKT